MLGGKAIGEVFKFLERGMGATHRVIIDEHHIYPDTYPNTWDEVEAAVERPVRLLSDEEKADYLRDNPSPPDPYPRPGSKRVSVSNSSSGD